MGSQRVEYNRETFHFTFNTTPNSSLNNKDIPSNHRELLRGDFVPGTVPGSRAKKLPV